MGYFISNQHINRGLYPSIYVIDGIYNIRDRSTLHILVANMQRNLSHLTKDSAIGHIEPSIDCMPQTSINSVTTQKMIDEHLQPDTFTPPLHTLPGDVRKLINYCRHLNCNLHRMKQALEQHPLLKCKLTWATQNPSQRGQTPVLWSTMTA